MNEAQNILPTIGFLGLGAMGGPMARNLLKAGYPLMAYDPDLARLTAIASAGAVAAQSAREVVTPSEIILTSLPASAVFVHVAETDLLPNAQPGQIFIDLGTTTAAETRRLAAAFTQKEATLLDSPVSGGSSGAEAGMLRMFIGGDQAVFERCRPIFDVLGDPEHTIYCGPSGAGQIVKGVNQLAMGLGDAAYMEALAFGVRAGVDPAVIAQAVGGSEGWRGHFARLASRAVEGSAEGLLVKFPELPYFLGDARTLGFDLPLTQALFNFCDLSPRNWRDNMGRPTVSFWYQLTNRPGTETSKSGDK